MLASPSLALEVRVMFFELYVHDGQAPVRRPMLSGDSSCYLCLSLYIFIYVITTTKQDRTFIFGV